MKKLSFIILLISLVIGTQVFADVVTTTRKIRPEKQPMQNLPIKKPQPAPSQQAQKPPVKQNKLVQNVRTCKPYSEKMSADFLGMGFLYNISIKGWVNNKCQIDFSAQTTGVSPTFSKIYGIDPSEAKIFSYAPKVRCAFTRQQLEYVGDSILQEEERNAGAKNNMLKDPNQILLSSPSGFSQNDEKLLDVMVNQGACQILNLEDLNNVLNNLF